MIHIVSYSYPPDNVPAAHRPHQLAAYLQLNEIPFRLYTRQGVSLRSKPFPAGPQGGVSPRFSDATMRQGRRIARLVEQILDMDKALPWGMRMFPRLWFDLVSDLLRRRHRPTVWATAPGMTNLYLATLAGMLSGSRVHIDLRDAINGINSRPAPLLTRVVLHYASSVSVVTRSLREYALRRAPFLNPLVVYNGVPATAVAASQSSVSHTGGWLTVSYVGAIYGGERPCLEAIVMLRQVAELLPVQGWKGICFQLAGREDVSELPQRFDTEHFRIHARREVPKTEALRIIAGSHINLVLVGSSESHRCGIPLKTFELIGVGRPVLYIGPADADAKRFLDEYAGGNFLGIEKEALADVNVSALADWMGYSARAMSVPRAEPNAAEQARRIHELIVRGAGRQGDNP